MFCAWVDCGAIHTQRRNGFLPPFIEQGWAKRLAGSNTRTVIGLPKKRQIQREISGPVIKLIEIDQWSKISESGDSYKLNGD